MHPGPPELEDLTSLKVLYSIMVMVPGAQDKGET